MWPLVSGKEASMKQSFLKSCSLSRRICRIRRLLAVHLYMSQMNHTRTPTPCLLKAILRLVLTYPVHLVVPKWSLLRSNHLAPTSILGPYIYFPLLPQMLHNYICPTLLDLILIVLGRAKDYRLCRAPLFHAKCKNYTFVALIISILGSGEWDNEKSFSTSVVITSFLLLLLLLLLLNW